MHGHVVFHARWYPSVLTMPDGNVLVVGGSIIDGLSGYGAGIANDGNSPTYQYYDPTTGCAPCAPGVCASLQFHPLEEYSHHGAMTTLSEDAGRCTEELPVWLCEVQRQICNESQEL